MSNIENGCKETVPNEINSLRTALTMQLKHKRYLWKKTVVKKLLE